MCSDSEAGSYLRLIDSCTTQLKAQGPSRTCNESKEEGSGRCLAKKVSETLADTRREVACPSRRVWCTCKGKGWRDARDRLRVYSEYRGFPQMSRGGVPESPRVVHLRPAPILRLWEYNPMYVPPHGPGACLSSRCSNARAASLGLPDSSSSSLLHSSLELSDTKVYAPYIRAPLAPLS